MWSLEGSFDRVGHVRWAFAENAWDDDDPGLRVSITLPGDMALTMAQTIDSVRLLLKQSGDAPWMKPKHSTWGIDLDGIKAFLGRIAPHVEAPEWLRGKTSIEPEFQTGQRTHRVRRFIPGDGPVPGAELQPAPQFDNSLVFYLRAQEVRTHMTWKFDLFVCHASEDKGSFVDTLVAELRAVGLRVWYDDFELTVGDRLRQAIDKGLLESEFGVVVLSHNFFKKKWPQDELEGMAALERDGRKVILPVWFDIDQAGVSSYSPTLAGRMAAQSALGTAQVVLDLQKAMKRERNKGTTGGPPGSSSTATRSAIAPESPAFEATTPVWMSSCFLKDDETLLQLETTGGVVDVIWRNGPQAFVRLIPSKSNAWTPKQLLVLLTKPEAPLLKPGGMGANCQWRRSKRGAVVFFAVERESITTTLRFSQVFTSGELWGVDKGLLAGMSGGERPFIPSVATERFFMDTLKNYLRFAKDALNLSLPLRFVGGLSGIEGLSITLPGNTNLLGGRVVEDEALYDASIDTYQIDPETFLMPLFERIWDACGLERPEQL